jgi:hypothetical protein
LPAELQSVLNGVAPIYSRNGWLEQKARYGDWFDGHQKGEVDSFGDAISADLVKAFGERWPGAIHVDLIPYAGGGGAYTRAWPSYLVPLQKAWLPHLDGKMSLKKAVEDLLAAIPSRDAGR